MRCVLLLLLPLMSASAAPFVFGTASASWQYEGATAALGRGPTIWDQYCQEPGPTGISRCSGQTASVADDQFNLTRLADDIKLMQQLNTTAYRLSLAWSRIMPTGMSPVEPRGIAHYRKVLQMLRAAKIDPYVTLFHFDLPLELEELGGWRNGTMVQTFAEYAAVCFEAFGDLVKEWITINEAHTIATAGYLYGVAAPGRCSNRSLCVAGDGAVEPYIVGHNLLLAHAAAVQVYRTAHQQQSGRITMVISGDWTEPDVNPGDAAAAQRRQEFQIGWFGDPIWYGDYPASMRRLVGDRLPQFTEQQRHALHGSADYFAINHYTSRYGQATTCPSQHSTGWDDDQCCVATVDSRKGVPIGIRPGSPDWLYSVPWGLRKLLVWLQERYAPAGGITVTENGCADPAPGGRGMLNDTWRIQYHDAYLNAVRDAITKDGVDVRGYFVWSLLDNFEWGDGFNTRFGLYAVENLRRIPKASVEWFAKTIEQWRRG